MENIYKDGIVTIENWWKVLKGECSLPEAFALVGTPQETIGWVNDFPAFLAHIGRRPTKRHTLDRLDNDKGYFPGNLGWRTYQEQSNNQRRTLLYTHNGQTMSLKQWAEQIDMAYHTLYTRVITNKWDFIEAIKTSVRKTSRGDVAQFTTKVKPLAAPEI